MKKKQWTTNERCGWKLGEGGVKLWTECDAGLWQSLRLLPGSIAVGRMCRLKRRKKSKKKTQAVGDPRIAPHRRLPVRAVFVSCVQRWTVVAVGRPSARRSSLLVVLRIFTPSWASQSVRSLAESEIIASNFGALSLQVHDSAKIVYVGLARAPPSLT